MYHMKKKFLSGMMACFMLLGTAAPIPMTVSAAPMGRAQPEEIVLEKSTQGNPIAGFDENGSLLYAGDPSILVDGDTVYLYVGHDDQGSSGGYNMPNYYCYSTKDMKTWEFKGEIMNMTKVSWADNSSAWAAQVIKYQDMYYLLYCAEKPGTGKCVGAAVSESPTGPFVDKGILISPNDTRVQDYVLEDGQTVKEKYNAGKHSNGSSFGWEDIDPTAWIEEAKYSKDGKEHVYMGWGNTYPWMCELEIDGETIKVKDQDGDGKITQGMDKDLWYQDISGIQAIASNGNTNDMVTFTEAPYLYRRQDADGNYFGDYYLFYATHWREEMGYARSTDITSNKWTHGGVIMEPTATSDTNHPAVFNFQGHTYFIYHNGSLAAGMGQRRVICVEELFFNEDGSIQYIQETSTGLTGFASRIEDSDGVPIAHESFNNSLLDSEYSVGGKGLNVKSVRMDASADKADRMWEIEPGKSDKENESYVSIESYNKPGTYLRAVKDGDDYKVTLEHDINGNKKADSKGITAESDSMTFRTLKGLTGSGVTFESVAYYGYYLTSRDGALVLSDGTDAEACTFNVSNDKPKMSAVSSVTAQKTTRTYRQGSPFSLDDIRLVVRYENGTARIIKDKFAFKVDASLIDMAKTGEQKLKLTYNEFGNTYTKEIPITVYASPSPIARGDVDAAKPLPAKNSSRTVGNLNYKVTKVDEENTDGTNGTVTVTGMKGNKTSVKIPDTVTIDDYTFKVNAIGSKAFYNKKKLKTITMGSNVTSVGKDAIKGIHKKAVIKVSAERYKEAKKLFKSSSGFKKTMKIKKGK